MIGTLMYQQCCHFVTVSSFTNRVQPGNDEDKIYRVLRNFSRCMSTVALYSCFQRMHNWKNDNPLVTFIAIPFGIPLATRAISWLAKRTGLFADKAEAVDRNLGKVLDVVNRIGACAAIILLAPKAPLSLFGFGIATCSVLYNISEPI